MILLAIETSCDDTSVAIFEDKKLLAMSTKSQIKLHNETGGVVPEVAAREHANAIFGVIEDVLKQSNLKIEDIDYIWVTERPGLLPSLLTGLTVADVIGDILGKKVIYINHIEAHIFANYLERKEEDINYPLVCLTISGGHNDIYFMPNMFSFERVGGTTDDASGEAFDKVAKMMGLGYPWGPIISKLAGEYRDEWNTTKQLFPRVYLEKDKFEFSFSWLKSAVKREIDSRWELTDKDKKEIAFEFEEAVIEVLAYKLINAAKHYSVKTILLAGGVSANDRLKDEIKKRSEELGLDFVYPMKKSYSMDNAAMVGIYTYYKVRYNKI